MKNYINFNGEIIEKEKFSLELSNRAFRFGDSIFETIRVFEGKIIFIDEHFSRLKSTLKIVRMNIPEYFTGEYLESEILKLVDSHQSSLNARIRMTVYRKASSSIYFVDGNEGFDFVIEYSVLKDRNFGDSTPSYEIDVFDEIRKPNGVLSQIKSNNVILHSIAGSVATAKSINNIVLLNENGYLTEAVNANIFVVKGGTIITPKLTDGCVDGIMRSNVINIIKKQTNYQLEVRPIDVNELQSSDEVFLTNSIIGVQPVYKYKNTNYSTRIIGEIKLLISSNINSLLDRQES
jgi:branched-chain amino acid aminotransferase